MAYEFEILCQDASQEQTTGKTKEHVRSRMDLRITLSRASRGRVRWFEEATEPQLLSQTQRDLS